MHRKSEMFFVFPLNEGKSVENDVGTKELLQIVAHTVTHSYTQSHTRIYIFIYIYTNTHTLSTHIYENIYI